MVSANRVLALIPALGSKLVPGTIVFRGHYAMDAPVWEQSGGMRDRSDAMTPGLADAMTGGDPILGNSWRWRSPGHPLC